LIKIGSTNSSRIEIIPIGQFNSGIYRILVHVIDRDSGSRQEITSRFKIIKENSEKTDILPMSDEEAQMYLDQIKYIATSRELDIYDQLNPQGKQEFLLQFWKSRDSNPNTTENEFMLEHFRRLSLVKAKFKGGINSDMGRIYIKYGPPYEIERKTSSVDISREIEVWTYAVDGRSQFVFVNRTGDGNFALVHSTHRDEFSNPSWQQDL
jgi:GWxTD domain-containing protein